MGAPGDHLFESVQRLQPMLDSFNESLSELCKASNNSPETLALRNKLESYYRELHKNILSRCEILKENEKQEKLEKGNEKFLDAIEKQAKQEKEKEKILYELPETDTETETETEPEPEAETETEPEPEPKAEDKGKNQHRLKIGYMSQRILPIKVRPEIESLCEKTDGDGLRQYIQLHRRQHAAQRYAINRKANGDLLKELPAALAKASDPVTLVLKALRGGDFSKKKKNRVSKGTNKVHIILLEALFLVFKNVDVPEDVKDRAREIARVLRQRIEFSKNADNVEAFLRLLATFRIAGDYGQEELCDLLMHIAGHPNCPALVMFLGLSDRMTVFVDKLSKAHKWIEAIRYALVFGIMNEENAANLVKAYLEDSEKAAKHIGKKVKGLQKTKEISALKRVMRVFKKRGMHNAAFIHDLQYRYKRLVQVRAEAKTSNLKARAERIAAAVKAGKSAKSWQQVRAEGKAAFEKAKAAKAEKKAAGTETENKKAPPAKADNKNVEVEEAQHKRLHSTEVSGDIVDFAAKADNENGEAKGLRCKRLRSTESGGDIVEFVGTDAPAVVGLYRPSQRLKYALESEVNRVAGEKDIALYDVDLFGRCYADNIGAVGPSMYGSTQASTFVSPSSIFTVNNGRSGSAGHPLAFGNSNVSPTGPTLYITSAMTGALANSSFSSSKVSFDGRSLQVPIPASATAIAASSFDPDQVNYDGRSLQSSDMYNPFDRGLEQYIPTLGVGNNHSFNSSIHSSGASAVPFPNMIPRIFERRGPEQEKPGFASSNRFATPGGLVGKSAISKYQFNGGLRS